MRKYAQKREDRALEIRMPITWFKVFMWAVLTCFAGFSASGILIDAVRWIVGASADPIGMHLIVYGTMGVALIFTVYTFYNMYTLKSYRALLAYLIVLPAMILLNTLLPLILYRGFWLESERVTSAVVVALLFLGTSLLYFPRRKLLFDDMHYRYIDWNKKEGSK